MKYADFISRYFYFSLLILFLTSTLSLDSYAQIPDNRDLIPENNRDLETVLDKIKEVEKYSKKCAGGNCPTISCETANNMHNVLFDGRDYAKLNYFWLRIATDKQKEIWQTHVNSSIRDGERLAKVQTILAYQEYVINIAGAMLDLTSAASSIDSILKNPTKLDEMSDLEFLNLLDTSYEGLKSYESATKTLNDDSSLDVKPKVSELTSDEINNHKSTLSDIKTVIQEAKKNGRNWRAILKSGNIHAALGQIVGRYLKAFAEKAVAERKEFADSLSKDLDATDRVLAARHRDYIKYMTRRNLAEDAYRSLEKLFDKNQEISWMKCVNKLNKACGSFKRYSSISLPEYAQVQFFGDDFDRARPNQLDAWGRTLRHIKPILLNSSEKITSLEFNKIEPTITLEKTTFKPNEDFMVRFTIAPCISSDSWIGIVPSDVPHGDEKINRENIAFFHDVLRNQSSGDREFRTNFKEGSYDIRMNDPTTGKEIASVSFNVTARTDTPPTENDNASKPKPTSQLPIKVPFPEGNWIVKWQNAPTEEQQNARFVLTKGVNYECLTTQSRDCWYGFVREPNADWLIRGLAYYSSGKRSQLPNHKITVGSSGINIKYGYYIFGQKSQLKLNGENNLRGTWTGHHKGEDISGQVIWKRAIPKINRAVFRFTDKRGGQERIVESSMSMSSVPPTEVAMQYDRDVWGQENNTRGNRPRFYVDIYGENLWGLHYQWIDRKTALEFSRPNYICGDGSRNRDWVYCKNDVVGVSYEVIIWSWIKNGMKTLYLDGIPIPFEMKIIGLSNKITINLSCANTTNGEILGRLSGTVSKNDQPYLGARVSLRVRYPDGQQKTKSVITDRNGYYSSDFPFIQGKEEGKVEASIVHNGERIISKPCNL
jgi:hypothetical protein